MRRIIERYAATGLLASGLAGCVALTLPSDSPGTGPAARTPEETASDVALLQDARFEVWDMHARGISPGDSVKVMDAALAPRGYWFSSAALGMPKGFVGDNNGAGKPIADADLDERERTLQAQIAKSGLSGTSAMVMFDAEAFRPYDSDKALEWYNRSARVADEHFENWFWYFQPYRFESSKGFDSEEEYLAWHAEQDFIRLASAISVTLYHGRDQDARNPASAESRVSNDRNLKRAIQFAERVGKPLIVTVRADLSGKPRQTIMSSEALEASWRGLFMREGVDGIAIWSNQGAEDVAFDREWARTRIEPVLRKLLAERAEWLED